MCVCISAVNELLIGVVQHPQLRLVGTLVEQRTQQTEIRDDLAGFSLGEVVRQLQCAHLPAVGQSITTAAQNSDLRLNRPTPTTVYLNIVHLLEF